MKLILENWRKFLNEGVMDDKPYRTDAQAREDVLGNASKLGLEENNSEEKIEDALVDTLEKEGGAAGFKPLFDAAREIDEDITEEEVKDMLSALSSVRQHEDEDYIDISGLKEAVEIFLEAKEELLDEKKRKKKKKKKKKKGKKDACYHKVKSRYDVWPSAYASGALVKCRKVGAKNWGKKSKKNESIDLQEKTDGKKSSDKGYGLDDWFDKGGWVQVGGKHDGKPCAKQPGQTTKPYCRDPDDRKSMSKKEKEKRAAKKRKEDPNPDRKGKAKNVSQKESLDMKVTKEYLQQIIKEEIKTVLNKEEVRIHGARGLKNGRDVYYMQDKSDERDAGQRPELSIESQREHCRARSESERVHFNEKTKRCEYDYLDEE